MVNKIKEWENFCKDCYSWIWWYTTVMGVKHYSCRLGVKPTVDRGRLVCKWRKEKEEK